MSEDRFEEIERVLSLWERGPEWIMENQPNGLRDLEFSDIRFLVEEVKRLSIYHEDDEPTWRHRSEKLEKELKTAREDIVALKRGLEDAVRREIEEAERGD